jgi:hypothetical protein
MDHQTAINHSVANSISILNKALMNIIERQIIIFGRQHDDKFVDLCMLDRSLLVELQAGLEKLKQYI